MIASSTPRSETQRRAQHQVVVGLAGVTCLPGRLEPEHGVRTELPEVRRHRSRPVAGLRALVHGHFVVDEVERIANRWNIDTGATLPGRDWFAPFHVNAWRIRPRTFEADEES